MKMMHESVAVIRVNLSKGQSLEVNGSPLFHRLKVLSHIFLRLQLLSDPHHEDTAGKDRRGHRHNCVCLWRRGVVIPLGLRNVRLLRIHRIDDGVLPMNGDELAFFLLQRSARMTTQ